MLTDTQRHQLERSKALICALIQQPDLTTQTIKAVDAEVLPPDNAQWTNAGPAQTEAVLESYKTSLQRATYILKQVFKN